MNALAAGSGRIGPVFHGREGNGVTISLDIVLPKRDRLGTPYGMSRACAQFFGTSMTYLRHGQVGIGYGEYGRGTTIITGVHNLQACVAAMRAATKAIDAAGTEIDEDAVEVDAREACEAEIRALSEQYTEHAVDTAVDSIIERALDPLSKVVWRCILVVGVSSTSSPSDAFATRAIRAKSVECATRKRPPHRPMLAPNRAACDARTSRRKRADQHLRRQSEQSLS
jgi:hypothetical protein